MFKGKITKVERPILNVYATFSSSFANDEKILLQKYLNCIVAPTHSVREVSISKDSEINGFIHIYQIPLNTKIASLYLKEIKVSIGEY